MSVELLSPAGSPENLHFAVNYGADAVYAGIPRWSLRVRGNGFTLEDFAKGIAEAHNAGRKFYAVLNAIPHMRRINSGNFKKTLTEIASLHPDAFIMADPGLIMQARETCPEIPVHLSVQANTVNAGTVKFWQKNGVTRCILARELPISEIEMIRNECPDAELEVFVHGALCIAVSGRCLISGLLARRDANTGACNNSCRWPFQVRNIHAATSQGFAADDDLCLKAELEDHENHPGEWMQAEEDCHGTYLMNSKDLCALSVLKKLIDIGVDSLKIEGRSRSAFYVGAITRAYRLAIDAIERGEDIPALSWELVNSIPSRGYTTALLEPHRPDETQDYTTNSPTPGRFQVTGAITSQDPDGLLHIAVKNRFERTSSLKLFTPQGLFNLDATELRNEKNGEKISVAPGTGYFVTLPCAHKLDLSTTVLLRDDGISYKQN